MSTTSIVPFSFAGNGVRVVTIDGEPWFVGKDVCAVLGYANPNNAMNDHCKGVAERYPLPTPGGPQLTRILRESDVYRLIMRSTLPAATRFETWVMDDVLPQIRRTGRFAPPEFAIPTTLHEALRLAADKAEEVTRLEGVVAAQAPKVAVLEAITAAEGELNLMTAAKVVGMPPRKFIARLHEKCWIYRRTATGPWCAHQDKVRNGCLVERITHHNLGSDGTTKARAQVHVTPKGIVAIKRALQRAEAATTAAAALALGQVRDLYEQQPAG